MYEELFKQAMDWNVIVFDCDAKEGIISRRLIKLMEEWAKGDRGQEGRPEHESDHTPCVEIVEWIFPQDAAMEITLVDNIGFSVSDEIGTQAYKAVDGHFPRGKSNIIMGIGYQYMGDEQEKQIAILGAF